MLLSHYGGAKSVNKLVAEDYHPLYIISWKAPQEVLFSSFITDNNLCFSFAPKLIECTQALHQDSTALKSLAMNCTTASYKLKYRIAKTFKERLVNTLKKCIFL